MAVDAQYSSFMAQFQNREKMLGESNNLNLGFGIPISLADTLQNFPVAGNAFPYNNYGLNIFTSTAILSNPQSGLTTNNTNITNSRKRSRECSDSFLPPCRSPTTLSLISADVPSFLGPGIAAQIQQQQQEIERFIAIQMEKVRLDFEEKRRRHARRLVEVIEAAIMRKLEQKETEIKNIEKLNSALEEKVRSLSVENQLWQNLARSNEATANALKTNLAKALAPANEGRGDSKEDAVATAESCCCDGQGQVKAKGGCSRCREGESSVLLLPCRHLCLCGDCAPAVDACPICQCTKSATVQVYLS